jgi:hypothetical protein
MLVRDVNDWQQPYGLPGEGLAVENKLGFMSGKSFLFYEIGVSKVILPGWENGL